MHLHSKRTLVSSMHNKFSLKVKTWIILVEMSLLWLSLIGCHSISVYPKGRWIGRCTWNARRTCNHRGFTLYGRVCNIFYHLVRLFVWGLSFHSRLFQSYGDVTITGEGLRILTFARQSWPLSVPDLLWYEASHLRRSMILTPIAERLYNKQLSCQYLFTT